MPIISVAIQKGGFGQLIKMFGNEIFETKISTTSHLLKGKKKELTFSATTKNAAEPKNYAQLAS